MRLYEHQRLEQRPQNFNVDKSRELLQSLWQNRFSFGLEDDSYFKFDKNTKQRYLKFGHKSLTAGNYVGVIKIDQNNIEIYPKIFEDSGDKNNNSSDYSKYVFSHVLWWLSYTDNIRLPKTFSSFDTTQSDFLEVIMYHFAYYTEKLISEYQYYGYNLKEEDTSVVRGRIKFNKYIKKIAEGNWHSIPVEYNQFQIDNRLNRIIRYVSKLLYDFTTEKRTKRLLDRILNDLEYVSDVPVTIHDCDKVMLNPLFDEYEIVLDYCKMFISNSSVTSYKDDISVFSFLIKTENLYERFLLGFMKKHKKKIGIKNITPSHKTFLAKQKDSTKERFNVKMDYLIVLENGEKIIADAKYKRMYKNEDSSNRKTDNYGIQNSDIFQMISYSYRKDINRVMLLYPSYYSEKRTDYFHDFDFLDGSDQSNIDLKATTLPIINRDRENFKKNLSIDDLFKGTEQKLINKLVNCFN